MLNKVMLIGRLGKDPESRHMQNGTPVTNMRIATDESYTDKDGNRVDRAEWHSVVVFGRAAENCQNYLAKGSLVYVEGSLQTRKWQDQQGQDRYSTEIKAQRVVFLDRKGEGRPGPTEGFGRQGSDVYARQGAGAPQQRNQTRQPAYQDEEMGPAFPSEANSMDEPPF